MLVSTNIIAVPKDTVIENFEKNGLSYSYKLIFELDHANLVIEVIQCSDEQKFAYVSPEDFEDQNTQVLITNHIIKFLQELQIISEPEQSEEKMDSEVTE